VNASLKQLAADVRSVWNPPGGRAWSRADLAMVKLLKAIEDAPDVTALDLIDKEIAAADRKRDGEVSDHPQTKFDGQQLGEALRRVRASLA